MGRWVVALDAYNPSRTVAPEAPVETRTDTWSNEADFQTKIGRNNRSFSVGVMFPETNPVCRNRPVAIGWPIRSRPIPGCQAVPL